ncbi:hypothetical protein PSEUDO8AS_80005 [Pseudomonas sp. 8AS]|nr:hypothetical protein PSEUDO8AS_80005 [Pseudomonas sp. 8AS]
MVQCPGPARSIGPAKSTPLFCMFVSIKRHPPTLPRPAGFSSQETEFYTVPVQLPGVWPGRSNRSCSFGRMDYNNEKHQ